MTFSAAMKRPSGYLPVAMSTLALGVLFVHITVVGTTPEHSATRPDEGVAAHLWQILMAGQLPVIAFFAIRWLRRDLRAALPVLGLQVGSYLAALAPVFLLGY